MRVVLDTNILISGLTSPDATRPPGVLIDAVRRERLRLVTSRAQLAEFAEVVGRPHLQKYLKPGVAVDFLRFIEAVAEIVSEPLPEVTESADPADNRILATALGGKVELIVSGDRRHVRSLGVIRGIEIVSAGEAVKRLKTG